MHRFRITIEPVSTEDSTEKVLTFDVTNHDDILDIVSRRPSRFELSEDDTKAMMTGLKLLSEVILRNRTREPFAQLRPALQEFTMQVKSEKEHHASNG